MKIKTIIIGCLFTVTGFIIGCGTETAHAKSTNNFQIEYQNDKGNNNIYTTVDIETGVEYIIVNHYKGGVAITPRYNADGSLYTSK